MNDVLDIGHPNHCLGDLLSETREVLKDYHSKCHQNVYRPIIEVTHRRAAHVHLDWTDCDMGWYIAR